MGLTLAKCPACGAELNLEVDKDYFYCPHCGSKVLKQDERIVIEHVIRTVNEAKVKKEELKQAKVAAKTEEKRIEAERQKVLEDKQKRIEEVGALRTDSRENIEQFISALDLLQSASEIQQCINMNYRHLFDEEFLLELEKGVEIERMYGNRKKKTIAMIQSYLQAE